LGSCQSRRCNFTTSQSQSSALLFVGFIMSSAAVAQSYGGGISRSLQILRANKSRISQCLGIAERLFLKGFSHQLIAVFAMQHRTMAVEVPQQLAPLPTDKVPSSKPLSPAARASLRLNSSASVNICASSPATFTGSLLGVYAQNLFDPADPPISVPFNNRCVRNP
jgi:hypothetical protein